MQIIEPGNAEAAGGALADASARGLSVRIQGGGTKIGWNTVDDPAVVLSTRRLDRLIAHRAGDLTATIEAGATLAAVNRQLASHGQWLPLDPAWPDRATVGGLLATNDAGPRRHRYGAPRDLIIGVEIARADGVRAKAGGIVVKNVAGYDLSRLMTGSFGTLALILSATFKLYPLPAASRTVVIDVPAPAAAAAVVRAMTSSQLTPTALELQSAPLRVLVRFESTERSAQHQAEMAARLAETIGGRAVLAAGADEQRLWDEHRERPWSGRGAVLKVTLLPSMLAATLDAIAEAAGGSDWEAVGRAGVGVLLVRADVDHARAAQLIGRLREQQASAGGSAIVLRGPRELRESVGSAAAQSSAFAVMRAVKRAFDPSGILPAIETLG